jgi:hypothetical protein
VVVEDITEAVEVVFSELTEVVQKWWRTLEKW